MTRLLVHGGFLVPVDPAAGAPGVGDLLIEDGRIARVGGAIEGVDAERLDAGGLIVLPGFVDTHRHTWQTALRHRMPNTSFADYGAQMLGRVSPHYSPDDVYIGTLLGAISALDAGTTCLLDWSHIQNTPEHADAAVAALRAAGTRAVFAHGYPRDPSANWTRGSELPHPRDILRLREDVLSDDTALVTLAMAARGPEMTTPEVARADLVLARELGIRVSMHVGAADFGPRHQAVRHLHDQGLLGPDMCLIHLSSTSAEELAMVAASGAHVSLGAWCETITPGLGGCPIAGLRAAGIEPSLSGDTEVNGSGDMFTQMRALLAADRASHLRPGVDSRPLRHDEVLRFATLTGAEACGLAGRTGSITPGKEADLVLVRATDLNLAPATDPVASVVLAAHPGNVDTVIVAGELRKKSGRIVGIDVPGVVAEASKSAERLLAAVGGRR
jgi:5-methylthioadenosine/S-adenosylhomocysteine deaminase